MQHGAGLPRAARRRTAGLADPAVVSEARKRVERSLICEVSDARSTAPRLRRARLSDEGGRGLLMVAELTRRWGTRCTPTGKTNWAEQSIGEG